jgi:peptide/nickel transport system substrate-binding protein
MRTSRRLLIPVLALLAVGLGLLLWTRGRPDGAPAAPAATARPLVAALRAEPRGYNRLVTTDRSSMVLSHLIHARLVHLNHQTQEIEPALAERWSISADGLTYTLALRPGLTFSDGAPFTADDVVFTFWAAYDPKVASPLAAALLIDGKPIEVRKRDAHTVDLVYPAPYGPGLRPLAGLPILPAHKLRPAFEAGTLRDTWNMATPAAEIAGLGPFAVHAYAAGDRLELRRNPRYGARGVAGLPRIERLVLRVIPTQAAEVLALEAGEIDLLSGELRADDLAALRKRADAGELQLYELGTAIDADMLWFNLADGGGTGQPWRDVRFRRGVAHAVDRRAFVDTVYLGAGTPLHGPVTPGNKAWHHAGAAGHPFDVARARALFTEAGLRDRNGDGTLEGGDGRPFRLELLTQKGHAVRERAAAFLEADLEKAGLAVDVVPLDVPALSERLSNGKYQAAYFTLSSSDTDPSANLDFWLSSGVFHVWHAKQATPATPWEAEVDRLMRELTADTDQAARRRRFARVQDIVAEQLPVIVFAAPHLVTAASRRVADAQPSPLQPYLLWRADSLTLR